MTLLQMLILMFAPMTYLIFLGCHHQHIGSDKGCQGVPIAQVVAVGGEPSKEIRTVGW